MPFYDSIAMPLKYPCPLKPSLLLVLASMCAMLSGCSLIHGPHESSEPPTNVAQSLSQNGLSQNGLSQEELFAAGELKFAPYRRPPPLPAPPLEITHEVKREIKEFLKGDAACIRVSLERREPLKSTIGEIFLDEGVPLDLSNLAVIESRFHTTARSRAGAVGLWQFTRSTARMYGLKVEGRVDNRTDPVLSTIAAARLLRDLYLEFGDWYLALAAYNAGSGAVRRAIRKAKSTDFWEISRSGGLSQQTRNFIPRFIAATVSMKLSEKHGPEALAFHVEQLLLRHGTSLG